MSTEAAEVLSAIRTRRLIRARARQAHGCPRRCVDCKRVFVTRQVDARPLCGPCWRRLPVEVVRL